MYVARERRDYILRLLQQRGSIRSATLARELGVTDETIRTDLVALQAQGLLERTHGGARYRLPLGGNLPAGNARLDCRLAAIAAQRIPAGARLWLDDSPFSDALVAELGDKPCTLITASLPLLHRLSAAALPHDLLCPGGTLDKECGFFRADDAAEQMRLLAPSLAIISPPALRAHAAAYASPTCARWAHAAATAAGRTIAIVPAAALSALAPHTVEISLALLVTEDFIPPGFDGIQTETVPYIAPEDVMQSTDWDY